MTTAPTLGEMTNATTDLQPPVPTCPEQRVLAPVTVGHVMVALIVLELATLLAELQAEPAPSAMLVVVDVAAGLLGVALLPVLFRRPMPTALVLAALAAVSPVATPAATLATLYVARTKPLRTAIGVAAAGVVTHTLRGLWRSMPDLPLGWWVVLVVVAHAALLGWGAHAQAREQLLSSLRERAARAEADRDRMVREARAEERTRIAREMHDVLAHRLSLLATYAGALEFRPDAPPEQLSRAAGVVRDGVHQALDEVREVVEVLRYEAPGSDGFTVRPQADLDDLAELVDQARDAGSPVELVGDVERPVVGTTARTTYRIVQEALTNARKHAPGCPVLVRLGDEQAGLVVEVTNPLPGPTVSTGIPGSSTGLVGLAERVRIVGGRFDHERTADEFRVRAWLPWQP